MTHIAFSEISDFQPIELDLPDSKGIHALFTENRIDRSTLPDGLYAYDIRSDDEQDELFCTLEPIVRVNHSGTVVVAHIIPLPEDYAPIEDYCFTHTRSGVEWLLDDTHR